MSPVGRHLRPSSRAGARRFPAGFAARALLASMVAFSGCRVEFGPSGRECRGLETTAPRGEVMIYTSMYRHVLEAIDPILEAKVPGVQVEWLQSGSEKIQTRVEAELAAGGSTADLVLTSDPLWYARMKREGHLVPRASLRALALPRALVDREGAWTAARISTLVIAYDTRRIAEADAPTSLAEIFSSRFERQVTLADPLASGTAFTTLAFLDAAFGDGLPRRLRELGVLAAGGNSAALTRLEAGEYQVGLLLLENVLAARRNGAAIAFRVPKEGAILVPGPMALLERGANRAAAEAVFDAFLSPEVQAEIVKGDMHSPFEDLAPPEGAPPLEALARGQFQWTPAFIQAADTGAAALRARFQSAMEGP